jgi:hypothetical protein
MSDTSSNETARPDPLQGLRELAANPRLVKGANTETVIEFGRLNASSNATITATSLVDVRALAESVMFDATLLVSRLDLLPEAEPQVAPYPRESVAVSTVLQGAAAVTGAFALVCVVGTRATGTVLLHPLIALFLIVMSIGFYLMGRVRH